MVMGRPNKGVGHVDNCEGSEQGKLRTQVVLLTISGELPVTEACEMLGIQRPRFAEIRAGILQGAVDAAEPGRPGRPRKRDAETDQRLAESCSKIEQLEKQLEIERTRAAVAQILPTGRDGDQKGGSMTRQEKRKALRELRRRELG